MPEVAGPKSQPQTVEPGLRGRLRGVYQCRLA